MNTANRLTHFCLVALLAVLSNLSASDWKPLEPEHLGQEKPLVDSEAAAEAIFWEVRVADRLQGGDAQVVLSHYIRIKIFDKRAEEDLGTVDIPYRRNTRIRDIKARTIKPDGTIVELEKDAIHERTVFRFGKIRVKSKSFALPALEPGVIVEYRWREFRDDALSNYLRLHLQLDLPVQKVTYYVKPLELEGFTFRAITFNAENHPFTKAGRGYYKTEYTNMPAFREEAFMPPEAMVRAWTLVYYDKGRGEIDPDKYWRKYGRNRHKSVASRMKPKKNIQLKAKELVQGASSPEEKLTRLYEFCRSEITNVGDDASGLTNEQLEKIKSNKSASDTLKKGAGLPFDINLLFGALAKSAGFEVRYAEVGDNSDYFFTPSLPNAYFLASWLIAVKVGEQWRFFDPGTSHLPMGTLRWQEEGQQALIADPKQPVFVATPVSPPERSKLVRKAEFKLDQDGTLEGTVRVEYKGHYSARQRENYDEETAEQREDLARGEISQRLSGIEFSEIEVGDPADFSKPFGYTATIRVPGYAQRTGKRMFLQPAFFHHGAESIFPNSSRKYDIFFGFSWTEEDHVTIDLPEGYSLDNVVSPLPFKAGDVFSYLPQILIAKGGRQIIYKRNYKIGAVYFKSQAYPELKKIMDTIRDRDAHVVALKKNESAESAPGASERD